MTEAFNRVVYEEHIKLDRHYGVFSNYKKALRLSKCSWTFIENTIASLRYIMTGLDWTDKRILSITC